MLWTPVGGKTGLSPGGVVMPEERLSWPRTIGIGLQHVVAMFGATVLVPLLTGFPPATTILFSGIGTLVFLAVVRNRVPSYLGSSFAFIAPVIAAQTQGGIPAALGGIAAAGMALFAIGLVVQRRGARLIERPGVRDCSGHACGCGRGAGRPDRHVSRRHVRGPAVPTGRGGPGRVAASDGAAVRAARQRVVRHDAIRQARAAHRPARSGQGVPVRAAHALSRPGPFVGRPPPFAIDRAPAYARLARLTAGCPAPPGRRVDARSIR